MKTEGAKAGEVERLSAEAIAEVVQWCQIQGYALPRDIILGLPAERDRWEQVFADVDIDRQAIAAERDRLKEALQRIVQLYNDTDSADLVIRRMEDIARAALAQEQPEKPNG